MQLSLAKSPLRMGGAIIALLRHSKGLSGVCRQKLQHLNSGKTIQKGKKIPPSAVRGVSTLRRKSHRVQWD